MGVRDDEVGYANTALLESDEEFAPVDFSFGQRADHAEDHAFAIIAAYADGFECGTVTNGALDADLVIGGIEDEVADFGKSAGASFGKLLVELLVEIRNLPRRDLESAKLLHVLGDAAIADALDIEGGYGGLKRTVAAGAFFEK